MELVHGLSIEGISDAIAVGENKMFVAKILAGSSVTYLWTFDLHHHKSSHIGKEVNLVAY